MMTATLLLVLSATPCTRLVVTPFEPVATTPAEAKRVELLVRQALELRPGLCVQARAATVSKLQRASPAQPCEDAACAAARLEALEADVILSGVVLGAGGRATVTLSREGGGHPARVTAPATPAELQGAVALVVPGGAPPARRRWPAITAGLAALAAAGAGLALGLQARETERAISTGATGCAGAGAAYRDCFDGQVRTGRAQATGANVLLGAAGVFATGAVVLWVVPLP